MYKPQTITLNKKRPSLVTFTCWAIWMVTIPSIILLSGKMSGLPGFWNDPRVNVALPMPIGFSGLLLLALSTVGLWQLRSWGVLVYAAAGLMITLSMVFQPGTPGLVETVNLPNSFEWMLVAAMHLAYILKLWAKVNPSRRAS